MKNRARHPFTPGQAPAVADRMSAIDPFLVMDVQDRAFDLQEKGRRVIHMEIGQPDFAAPPLVAAAAIDAIRSRSLGYTGSIGLPKLREAISDHYRSRWGVSVDPSRVVVTAGASGGFLLLLGALLNPGDEVLMADPCYPCNRNFVRLFGATVRGIPVDEGQLYQPRDADVRALWGPKTRGMVIATPANPTGTVIPEGELRAIMRSVRAKGGFLIVDEIYQGLTYDGAASPPALLLSDEVFVVNSFSKYFNMTGWRLGWVVAPPSYVREIEKLAQNVFICPSAPAQYGALAAFHSDTIAVLEDRRIEFQRRRDYLVPALRDLGFRIPVTPQGAFYVYAGCQDLADDSSEFAIRILDEAGVAIAPGTDFGEHRARQHVRFAYTRTLDDLKEGVRNLELMLRPK